MRFKRDDETPNVLKNSIFSVFPINFEYVMIKIQVGYEEKKIKLKPIRVNFVEQTFEIKLNKHLHIGIEKRKKKN